MYIPHATHANIHFFGGKLLFVDVTAGDNSTQGQGTTLSSQPGPNLRWQCVSQGVRRTSRWDAHAFPAQSTDLLCALYLLLHQLQDPHLRRKSRSLKVRYALFVSSAHVNTDTTLLHMTSTIAAAVY